MCLKNYGQRSIILYRRQWTKPSQTKRKARRQSGAWVVSEEVWQIVEERWKVKSKGERERFNSVQFSRSVVSNSLWPHGPQHARPPCLSPIPGVYPNSCPLSWWCIQPSHPLLSPSPPNPQSFPASGSFLMSQLVAPSGQSIGVSASTSVLPMNTQDWSPLGWTGWISV